MNKPLLHVITALLAAGAGWLAGTPSSVNEAPPRIRRTVAPAGAAAPRSAVLLSWEQQLASVRAVPGARAETAWIKWAFAIPDSDMPAAIARLNPYADFHALRCLYARWAKLDPAAAWASFRKSAIPEIVRHFYMPEDTGENLRSMAHGTYGSSPRSLIAARMLASMETTDPAAAKAIAARLLTPGSAEARDTPPAGYLSVETNRLAGKKDSGESSSSPPPEAAAAAASLTDFPARGKALENAARNWLKSDPAAACAWLRQLPAADRGQFRLVNLDYLLRQAKPEDCATALGALLEARSISAEQVNNAYKPGGFPGFPGDGDAIIQTARAVQDWTRQDSTAARNWLASLPDGNLKATLAGTIAGELVRTDVNAGIALLNQTGGDQELAVGALMRGWMESDARAALAWAAKIDDAALRDTSRSTAARQIAATNPALALETAQTLTDPALRSGIIKQVRQALSWNPAALRELEAKYPGEEWQGSK